MMAASLSFPSASSEQSKASQSTYETNQDLNNAVDDEFGSFTAAEQLSDPFGDVYGAEAEFGEFVGGFNGHKHEQETSGFSVAMESSLLVSLSPLMTPLTTTAVPTLLPTTCDEIDPFAGITGIHETISGCQEEEEKMTEVTKAIEGDVVDGKVTAASSLKSSATSAILDLVWGKTSPGKDVNSMSTLLMSIESGRSRTASNSSGFALPYSTSTPFATFPSTAIKTSETSTDLLSFSPVQASVPTDPFDEIDCDKNPTSVAAPVYENDELFTMTAMAPLSSASSSAPTSPRKLFVSLHDDVTNPRLVPFAHDSVEIKALPRDPFAKRTTRPFDPLSLSFVGAGAMENIAGQSGLHASFSTFPSATPEGTSSLSAPPSLCSSSKMTDGFLGFAPVAAESDEADPFAAAGLAAPAAVSLVDALAAWSTDGEHAMDEGKNEDCVRKRTDEENAGDKNDLIVDASNDGVDTASVVKDKSDILNASEQPKLWKSECSRGDWTIATERNEAFGESFTAEHETEEVTVLRSPVIAMGSDAEDDENVASLIPNSNGNESRVGGLQGALLDRDNDEVDIGDAAISANSATTSPLKQNLVDDPFGRSQIDTFSFTIATMDLHVESASQTPFTGDLEGDRLSLHEDKFNSLRTSTPSVASELWLASDEVEENAVVGTIEIKSPMQAAEAADGDDFGDFGGFEATPATTVIARASPDDMPWGSSASLTMVPKVQMEDVNSVGNLAMSATTSTFAETRSADDTFGDFTQSIKPSGDDEFADFGNFDQSFVNKEDSFTDFKQSCAESFGSDNGFGDFAPAVAPTLVASPALSIPSLSKTELSAFFKEAFSTKPLPAISPDQAESPTEVDDTDSVQKKSTDFIHNVFRDMWDEYISTVAATGPQLSSSCGSLLTTVEPKDVGERVRLYQSTKRASKYLKYVLSEKIQEASKQNGIFAHGSERHQMYVGVIDSGDVDRMSAALKELQDALFHNSVNNAMMRIAKQAALSAKAKIAEQAAQQQATSRGGSLFSTTRHLLLRGGNAGGAHGPSSCGSDTDHAGADTPTGVSVQKLARFSLANNHDDSANAHRSVINGGERVSDGCDRTGHSSGSDLEVAFSADSRNRGQISSNSGSNNGGLMKKFQDRFSFSSTRHRPRYVRLRRNGQSDEEIKKMELNLDTISGGFDEVKWKCALFLYDVEEVTHVAPSQISILAYPSKQPLRGKTDRSALTKLVKSDSIWIVDIGANK